MSVFFSNVRSSFSFKNIYSANLHSSFSTFRSSFAIFFILSLSLCAPNTNSLIFPSSLWIPDLPHMADPPTSPAGGSHESGGEQSPHTGGVREQDRYLPIANISRIMKKALPANGKIAKDAKDTVQECVSEFISFITSEASDKCQKEKRKTINGDDLLWAMATLGFEDYIDPLKSYLTRYRELECDAKGSSRGGEESAKRDAVGALPGQNSQYLQPGALTYINTQFEEPGYPKGYEYKSSPWRHT
ncbi:nuclear transcription factor Y subunit B-1-like isoform X5 [Cucurbita moschata]|nr:nuclear transcription factor Y subunit B-1-like isoform X5 [Cucurbita moschata]